MQEGDGFLPSELRRIQKSETSIFFSSHQRSNKQNKTTKIYKQNIEKREEKLEENVLDRHKQIYFGLKPQQHLLYQNLLLEGDLLCVILHRSACSLYHPISVLLSLLQPVGPNFLSGRSALCVCFRLHGFPCFPSINIYSLFVVFPFEQPRGARPFHICCHLLGVVTRMSLYVCYLTCFSSVRIHGNQTVIRLSDLRLNTLCKRNAECFWRLRLEVHK